MVITIIVLLVGLSFPAFNAVQKRAALTKSSSNARQIRLALQELAVDFNGAFLNEAIATQVSGAATTFADASDAFDILIDFAALANTSEDIFHTPELVISNAAHVLGNEDGNLTTNENGYSYIANLNNASNGRYAVVTTQQATSGTFYSDVWDHKAVIARVDNAVGVERIDGAPTAGGTDAITIGTGADEVDIVADAVTDGGIWLQ